MTGFQHLLLARNSYSWTKLLVKRTFDLCSPKIARGIKTAVKCASAGTLTGLIAYFFHIGIRSTSVGIVPL